MNYGHKLGKTLQGGAQRRILRVFLEWLDLNGYGITQRDHGASFGFAAREEWIDTFLRDQETESG